MTVLGQTLLEGAWWAVVQAGRLVQASLAAYDRADRSGAISLAPGTREALERSKLFRALALQIADGETAVTTDDVSEKLSLGC